MTVENDGCQSSERRRGQHLYVFQDSTGRIKIGRSSDPAKRKKSIQSAIGRKITIVLVVLDQGDEEQRIMTAAHDHRKYGEWFANSDACRAAISAAIGQDITWPMPSQRYIAEWRKNKDREEMAAIMECVKREFEAGGPNWNTRHLRYKP